MARGALLFRERELTRAVRAMSKAGQTVARVEIGRDGKMVIVVGKSQDAAGELETATDANEWDSGSKKG